MQIRKAQSADARAIIETHHAAISAKATMHYSADVINSWAPTATDEKIARLQSEINDPSFIVLVAEHESDILGFSMAIPQKNELRAVYVKSNGIPDVGRMLLKEAERLSLAAGAKFLEMDASLNAEKFYQNNGYEVLSYGSHALSGGVEMGCVKMKKMLLKP